MNVYANHLSVLLYVGDNVVDGNLCGSTCRGGNSDNGGALILGGSNALKASNVCKLGVLDDDTDRLRGIHRGAATDGYKAVCTALLECFHAGLHVLDRGVGLNVAIKLVCDLCRIQNVGYLLGYRELNKIGVGAYKRLLEASCLDFGCDLLDRALAVIAGFVQYKSVCHCEILLYYSGAPLILYVLLYHP